MKKQIDFMEQLLTSVLVKVVDFNLGAYALFILFYFFFQLVVLASGVVAFSVNLSIYWIIGNTSPVTYP